MSLIFHQASLVLIAESGVQEKELNLQGLQSLGLELTHHPSHQTLVTKANHKPSPYSKGGVIDPTSSWEDLQHCREHRPGRPVIGAISAICLPQDAIIK